ncbi:Ribosome hibernation protein YhbH [Mucinivorans hirudinis]|uniref:Ribosome hibernation protein YhbH n=1 Tax=Mucinivorans hirudinis TaxID=1433126 RepID=A0A060R6W9_9BACT|nr:Ribosome hibernation protein YhbH [Mucinivorans hirudinis]
MNVQIQSVKFDADKKLITYIEGKLAKLDRFDDTITSVDVFLKLDHDMEDGNKVATIVLDVKGAQLVAERRSRSFEDAVDGCFEALKTQIGKRKE